jgi:hypothetical protein
VPAVRPIPETTISFNPETGMYGFSIRFPGKPPHYHMEVFDTVEDALTWCDPHRECAWEDASDADESRIMVAIVQAGNRDG